MHMYNALWYIIYIMAYDMHYMFKHIKSKHALLNQISVCDCARHYQ